MIRTSTCVYQGVRSVSFSESFAYVLIKWFHIQFHRAVPEESWRCRKDTVEEGVGRTLFQEIFTRFCNNFDFVPPVVYDSKAYNLAYIVYCKHFRVDTKKRIIDLLVLYLLYPKYSNVVFMIKSIKTLTIPV